MGEQYIFTMEDLRKFHGKNEILKGIYLSFYPGAKIGVLGPNGAGKTTLFKLIVGEEQPDAGKITIGKTVKIAYAEQNRTTLDGEKTVYDNISGGADFLHYGNVRINTRA